MKYIALFVLAVLAGCSTTPPDMAHPRRLEMAEYNQCRAMIDATPSAVYSPSGTPIYRPKDYSYCDRLHRQ